MGWHLSEAVRTFVTVAFRYLPMDPLVGRTLTETLRQVLLSGASVTVPFVITLLVLGVVLDFVSGILAPFARVVTMLGLTGGQEGAIAQVLTLGIIIGIVFLAGILVESDSNTGVERGLARLVEAVPGVGSVYTSFDRMSDVMLDSDSTSFKEVKLVEFPHADVYSLAFQTSEIPGDSSDEGDDERMLVLFVPLAPNPVMGGFMVCVPDHRVKDVDMTVQEAFQAIVTSGVAMTRSPSQ